MPKPASSTLRALRHALRRSNRPVMVRWVALGALTNLGVFTTLMILAVWLGNRFGIDFAIVDRESASRESFVPVAWLLVAAMASFPISGFLVSKASGADTAFEPAVASILAIAVVLATFGLAVPEVLVVAIIASPVAFALAAVGAWFGLSNEA